MPLAQLQQPYGQQVLGQREVVELEPQKMYAEEAAMSCPTEANYAAVKEIQNKVLRRKASIELYINLIKAHEETRDEYYGSGASSPVGGQSSTPPAASGVGQ